MNEIRSYCQQARELREQAVVLQQALQLIDRLEKVVQYNQIVLDRQQQELEDVKGSGNCALPSSVQGIQPSRYGNEIYMEGAHREAEGLRERLKTLGISDSLLFANLAASYKGSALSACAYDPRLSDGTVMPTDIWRSSDGQLSEDTARYIAAD